MRRRRFSPNSDQLFDFGSGPPDENAPTATVCAINNSWVMRMPFKSAQGPGDGVLEGRVSAWQQECFFSDDKIFGSRSDKTLNRSLSFLVHV